MGVSIVRRRRRGFKKAFAEAVGIDGRVLVEWHIKGREFSCGVLGNKDPISLPIIEIVPKTEFF